MRVVGAMASSTLMAAAATILGVCPSVHASSDDPALNGLYRATSDGQWAQTNDQLHHEATVTSTWTITSSCTNPLECAGQVTSDQGWSAPLRLSGGALWIVAHDVPNWEQCGDGMPAATGRQLFRFATNDLAGDDKTIGPSGACGVNKWLTVDLPFTLVKIG